MVLNAQMGKAGPPLDGKDLHIGDFDWGILPPAAPLAIATLTIAGMAMAFAREGSGRVAVSFIGDGGSSLGEWHEAINLCAARRLPAVFCVQNNQTALSTPVARSVGGARVRRQGGRLRHSRASRSTAPIPTRSPRRSRGPPSGRAPAPDRRSSSSSSMRMCGHAHHDDMLYPRPRSASVVGVSAARRATGATSIASCMTTGRARDPIRDATPRGSKPRASSTRAMLDRFKREARSDRRASRRAPSSTRRGPIRGRRARGVFADEAAARARRGAGSGGAIRLDRSAKPAGRLDADPARSGAAVRSEGPDVSRGDHARHSAMRSRPIRACSSTARTSAASTATRSCCLRPLLEQFGDRIINSPLAEGARARRLRRRGAGGAAADRRDAVQRLRRDRVQSAREQRRQDPLPLGRQRADGRAHAVRRSAPCRARITRRTPRPGSTGRRA